jgi:hypothetical protein
MAIKLVIEIDCSTFGEPDSELFREEVAGILKSAAARYEEGYTTLFITDSYGNRVGFSGFQLTEG